MSSEKQLLGQIAEDIYEGNICADSSSTLNFIEDIVSLLTEEQIEKFSKWCDYSYSKVENYEQ